MALEVDNIIAYLEKEAPPNPVLCKCISPWKKDGITEEDLLRDLFSCIVFHFKRYRSETCYSLQDAISDAYNGLRIAINKDKLAPTIAGKKIKCPNCLHDNQMPDVMPGDEQANRDYINLSFGDIPKERSFDIKCDNCQHEWLESVQKTAFTTHVWYYIRSEIQRGVKNARCRLKSQPRSVSMISIDQDREEDGKSSLLQLLSTREETIDDLPNNLKLALYDAIESLSPKQRTVLAMRHGLGGMTEQIICATHRCNSCNEHLEVEVDYSVSNNDFKCPSCGHDVKISMSLSQTEIANFLGVTKQRVCNMLGNSYRRLSDALKPMAMECGFIG